MTRRRGSAALGHAAAALTAAVLCAGAAPARASSGGIVGHSGKQNPTCNACHNGGSMPTVAFAAPAQVAAGATVTVTFSVHAGTPAQRGAGFNVAVENGGGTLAVIAGEGERLSRGELTHSEPKDNDDERFARWQFLWTAPTTPGSVRLFGAGNSVNLNRANTGDRSRTTTVDIEVVAAADSPTPTPTATPAPPTPSSTSTASPTEVPPHTATATATPSPPEATPTLKAPTPSPPPATVSATPSLPPEATATSTATPSESAPPDETPTASPTGAAACAGDCDGNRQVAINELIAAVSIALDALPIDACRAADRDGDAAVAIAELIAAVNAALAGC
jgi:hypothetical protein